MGKGFKLDNSVTLSDMVAYVNVTNWVLNTTDGFYHNTLSISGITESSYLVMALQYRNNIKNADEDDAYSLIEYGITDTNTVDLVAYTAPSISFSIVLKGAIQGSGISLANYTALNDKMEEVVSKAIDTTVSVYNTSWVLDSSSSLYTQRVDIADIKENINPVYGIIASGTILTETEVTEFDKITDMTVHDGYVVFYATETLTETIYVIIKNAFIGTDDIGGGDSVELTQQEYDALPSSKLTDNITYFIKD